MSTPSWYKANIHDILLEEEDLAAEAPPLEPDVEESPFESKVAGAAPVSKPGYRTAPVQYTPSPEKPRPVGLVSCNNCRRRKLRCDGARPACSTCASYQGKCAYRDKSERVAPNYAQALESLKQAEQILQRTRQDGAGRRTRHQRPKSKLETSEATAAVRPGDGDVSRRSPPPPSPTFGSGTCGTSSRNPSDPDLAMYLAGARPSSTGGTYLLPEASFLGVPAEMVPLSTDNYEGVQQPVDNDEDAMPVIASETAQSGDDPPDLDAASETMSSTSTSCSDSSDSDESDHALLSEAQRQVLDSVMRFFAVVFESWKPGQYVAQATSSRSRTAGVAASSNDRSSQGSASASAARPLRPSQKRRASPGDDGEDGDEDGHKDKRPNAAAAEPSERLACHFFKRNPLKYREERSCVGPGWRTVHRIKEHLYRCHMLPVHCFRCHDTFENDQELQTHMRTDPPCRVQCSKSMEGIDSSQEKLLRSRKKLHKNMSEVEKWKDVYTILFPKDDPATMPSPYYEIDVLVRLSDDGSSTSEMARYEGFLRQELPSRVRHELEARIEAVLSPREANTRTQLVDIVRDLQLELFEAYKRSRQGSPRNDGTGDAGGPTGDTPESASMTQPTPSTDSAPPDFPPELPPSDREEYVEVHVAQPEQWFGDEFSGFDGLLFNIPPEAFDQGWDSSYDSMAFAPRVEDSLQAAATGTGLCTYATHL